MGIQSLKHVSTVELGEMVINELLDYPSMLNQSELDVLKIKKRVDESKEKMDIKRYSLLASGVIDGKNAEVREAQISEKLNGEKGDLMVVKEMLEAEEANFHLLENEYRSLLAIARILSKEF